MSNYTFFYYYYSARNKTILTLYLTIRFLRIGSLYLAISRSSKKKRKRLQDKLQFSSFFLLTTAFIVTQHLLKVEILSYEHFIALKYISTFII